MRSLIKKINNKIDDRLRKIIETMISDVKASIDVLKRDYPDNPQAQEIVKELTEFDKEIEKYNLPEEYAYLESVTIRSFVEKYLELKQKLKQFDL
jgi:TRAP-type mannitol/chloroaromatic compound transport system substrate-binding protein